MTRTKRPLAVEREYNTATQLSDADLAHALGIEGTHHFRDGLGGLLTAASIRLDAAPTSHVPDGEGVKLHYRRELALTDAELAFRLLNEVTPHMGLPTMYARVLVAIHRLDPALDLTRQIALKLSDVPGSGWQRSAMANRDRLDVLAAAEEGRRQRFLAKQAIHDDR